MSQSPGTGSRGQLPGVGPADCGSWGLNSIQLVKLGSKCLLAGPREINIKERFYISVPFVVFSLVFKACITYT